MTQNGGGLKLPTQIPFPTLNQKKSGNAVEPPTGGFYSTVSKINLAEPLRAFNANLKLAQDRAEQTGPENAMTEDIHSEFWSAP